MRRLTINVDVDGVIYNFNGNMTRLSEQYLGLELPATTTWDMAAAWGMTEDDWYDLFHRAILEDDLFRSGHAIPNAVQAVRKLANRHRVRLVTSKRLRYPMSTLAAQVQTLHWLADMELLNCVEVVFTGDKQGYSADIVVDDKPTLKWALHGAQNLLFDQPWNQEVPDHIMDNGAAVRRVRGWEQVVEFVRWEASGTIGGVRRPEWVW